MCAVCSRRRQDAQVLAYALLIAAAVLFFCSKSSFGYPINDWSDANIYSVSYTHLTLPTT